MMASTALKLIGRNTLRRRARTLLTAGMVVLAVALLLLALSWVRGVFSEMLASATSLSGHVRVVTPEFAAREELAPLYENIAEVEPIARAIADLPGVAEVEPRIAMGVSVSVGKEIGDVFALLVGGSERYFEKRVGAREKLIAGRWFSGAAGEALAGVKVVEQLGAKPGDELLVLGMTQDGSLSPIKATLVGVVRTGAGLLDQQIFVPLSQARYLADIEGGATELLVYAGSYDQADALAPRLRASPALQKLEVQSWSEREPWSSISSTVNGIQNVIVWVIVFLTALGIWNTMMMSVLERTSEIGVMRAMGMSRWATVRLFAGEALVIAVCGGLLGVALGAYPAWLLESRGLSIGERTAATSNLPLRETMHGDLSWQVVAISFGLGLLMALLGSVVPALRAASIQPVAAMRTGR